MRRTGSIAAGAAAGLVTLPNGVVADAGQPIPALPGSPPTLALPAGPPTRALPGWTFPDDSSTAGAFYSLVQDPLVIAALIVAGGLAVVALERRSETSIRPEADDGDGDEDPLDARRRAVGTAVGRAADAVADGDDTFRAWTALAGELGIAEPGTATAEDLRSRAVEAGLSEADADRLADQFDVLRYGGAATDRREREAVATLRAIEDEYAGGPRDGEAGDDDSAADSAGA